MWKHDALAILDQQAAEGIQKSTLAIVNEQAPEELQECL